LNKENIEKPKVKFFLTENPLICIDLHLRRSIANPVLKELRDAGLKDKVKEFKEKYNELLYHRRRWVCVNWGPKEELKPTYFHEFFELASQYVEIQMYEDFRRYVQEKDEELRREDSLVEVIDD
jgi:hypothetical protein